jgi:hypothetical protein
MYVGLSYFLGAEIAERVGNAGAKAVLGVLLVVAIGLGVKAGLSAWRANRQRAAAQGPLPPRGLTVPVITRRA